MGEETHVVGPEMVAAFGAPVRWEAERACISGGALNAEDDFTIDGAGALANGGALIRPPTPSSSSFAIRPFYLKSTVEAMLSNPFERRHTRLGKLERRELVEARALSAEELTERVFPLFLIVDVGAR